MINHISELNKVLLEELEALRADPARMTIAKGISSLGGRSIATARVRLQYAQMRKEKPELPFLSNPQGSIH